MPDLDMDPLVKRAIADAVVERASSELKSLLHELASALDPFPGFMDIDSIQAVEIEPAGVDRRAHGCVVVCPDGELYELVLRLIPGPVNAGGVDHVEEMKPLDLPPGDYVAYAHAAARTLAGILEDQRG